MNPDEAQSFLDIFLSLAIQWWFIRSVGVTFISYGTRMIYKSHLYKKHPSWSKDKVDKKALGFVVWSHLFWTVIASWVNRREFIMRGEFRDIDIVLIEMLFFLCLSLALFGTWHNGIAPLSDKYLGTNFTKKK